MVQIVRDEAPHGSRVPGWSVARTLDLDAPRPAMRYDAHSHAARVILPMVLEQEPASATRSIAASPVRLAVDESTRQLEGPASVEDDAADSLYLREPIAGDELPPGMRVGRYSVLSRLGEGGMGVVYAAWDPQLDRRVALKVLRANRSTDDGTPGAQLLAEAQTLAKIEHPNIVTVYDAGVSEDRVFIAMELCRGQNLRQWLAQGEHGVREILEVFVAAGRGLAAAHGAGVVHRDFKPANVLIGEDGTIKVADFGMARLVELAVDTVEDVTAASDDPHRSVSTIVGTPTYMAPEQLLGRLGDHRMDQFSFCLCLYWALLDHPPFPGRTFQERRRVVPMGLGAAERERLHRARRIPVRVRRALLRGLSADPDARFESMDALLLELVERRAWPWAVSGLALAVGLGLGALAMAETQPEPCRHADAALGAAWGPVRRQAVAEAFERTGHPNAAEQLERVAGSFEHYAQAWQGAYAAACEATYVTRVQSEATFDLRMQCLERRRAQLDLAVQLVAHADDAQQLDARMSVPFLLPAIGECEDLHALESVALLPSEGPERRRIDDLLGRIDRANALREAGELQAGLVIARAAVAEAREIGHGSVLAQALECMGRLQADGDGPRAAELTLREAIEVGTRGGDDLIVARAWPSLVYTLLMQGELVAAQTLGFPAEVAVERAGDELARGWLLNTLGALHGELDAYDRARESLQRALGIKIRLRGEHDLDVGITWSNLGFVLGEAQRWREASEAFERAQAILAATVGPTHPLSDLVRTGLCRVELGRKRYDVALSLCEEALGRLEATSTSPVLLSRTQFHTADALLGLGRLDEALRMAERARARAEGVNPRVVEDLDEWLAKRHAERSPASLVDAQPDVPLEGSSR